MNVVTLNPEVPYGVWRADNRPAHTATGKDFETNLTYVLQGTSPTSSKLTVTAEMRFAKSPLIKGMILRGAKVCDVMT